jgi:hypothetical protein
MASRGLYELVPSICVNWTLSSLVFDLLAEWRDRRDIFSRMLWTTESTERVLMSPLSVGRQHAIIPSDTSSMHQKSNVVISTVTD